MNSQCFEASNIIPPPRKAPDIKHRNSIKCGVEDKVSFKDKLVSLNPMNLTNSLTLSQNPMEENYSEDGIQEHLMELNIRGTKAISLTKEDKQRIYEPWKFSIIVKLFGKRIMHHYLKKKIQEF